MNHFKGKYNLLKSQQEKEEKERLPHKNSIIKLDKSVETDDIITYEKEIMTTSLSMRKKSSVLQKPMNFDLKIDSFETGTQYDQSFMKNNEKDTQTNRYSEINTSPNNNNSEDFEIRKSVNDLKAKIRHSMKAKKESKDDGEEYDIYGRNSDKIDEDKIKFVGNLLTTMNMDNNQNSGIFFPFI